jgi:hypothetical protein
VADVRILVVVVFVGAVAVLVAAWIPAHKLYGGRYRREQQRSTPVPLGDLRRLRRLVLRSAPADGAVFIVVHELRSMESMIIRYLPEISGLDLERVSVLVPVGCDETLIAAMLKTVRARVPVGVPSLTVCVVDGTAIRFSKPVVSPSDLERFLRSSGDTAENESSAPSAVNATARVAAP